jgi:aminoglycoside phosphotransferase (APT) family kinase protein
MDHDPDPRDPVLDPAKVLELVRRHLPSAGTVTGVDETGGEARIYAIDQDVIFKTQRPHRVRPRTSLEKEAFHLGQLASCAPQISVPRVLGYGSEDGIEYLLMTRMPGVAMRSLALQGEVRAALLRELGSILRIMHALEVEPFRSSGLFPGDEDTSATSMRLERDLRHAVEVASAQRAAWTLDVGPEEVAARVRAGLGVVEEAPVPLHSNPGPEHVFVDPSTLRLTGVIDFGDAYLSHPALDLRRWGRTADRVAVMDGYAGAGKPLSASFDANWRAISVTALMLDFATRPSRRAESLDGLRDLLG